MMYSSITLVNTKYGVHMDWEAVDVNADNETLIYGVLAHVFMQVSPSLFINSSIFVFLSATQVFQSMSLKYFSLDYSSISVCVLLCFCIQMCCTLHCRLSFITLLVVNHCNLDKDQPAL